MSSAPRLDEVSALLVDVCRSGSAPRPLRAGAERELVAAARFHRVAPLVHVAHREVAPHVAELFVADRLRAITVHLRACAALQELGALLGDTPWATFKGPVLSEHAHPVPGIRTYNDVDVLVDPSSLRHVSRLLLDAGWRVADYRDMLRNPTVPGETNWQSPSGVFFDVHWSLLNSAARRQQHDVPSDEVLRRRVPVRLGPDRVWALDPVDALVHVCLHAALSGANKLVYLVDVDRLSRAGVEWHAVAARAREWRAEAQVDLVLGRARRVLGTPVPEDFGSRAGVPGSVRRMVAVTDRLAPVPRGRSNAGLGKMAARAVRPSGTATAGAFVASSTRFLAGKARRPDVATERPGPDDASLEVYLRGVESATGAGGSSFAHAGSVVSTDEGVTKG